MAGFIITEVYHNLIEGLYTYHFLTAEQVCRLYYAPGTITTVKARLKLLEENGYALSLNLPTIHGNSPHVYTLARKGLNYLRDAGFEVKRYFRPSQEKEKNYLFLMHTLELNNFLIDAATLQKSHPNYALVDTRHDLKLKHTPFSVNIDRDGKTEAITVIPDGWLDFRTPKRACIWVELDRGKHDAVRFKQHLSSRLAFIEHGGYEDAFDTTNVTLAYATTAGFKRVEHMKTWCEQELRARKGDKAKSYADWFFFTSVPPFGKSSLDPQTLFLSPSWSLPFSDKKLALLVE